VPTEPGVRVAASPCQWASSWDRRQPLGWGILSGDLVTASGSALWVLASRWAEEAQPLGDTGNRSLRAPLRARAGRCGIPGARALESPRLLKLLYTLLPQSALLFLQ
jgi:hypothetical protein